MASRDWPDERAERAMMAGRINRIELTSGEAIETADNLTVIVGPNNVGKSVILNSAWQHVTRGVGHSAGAVAAVSSVELVLPERQELDAKLERNAKKRKPGQHPQGFFDQAHYLLRNNSVLMPAQIDAVYAGGLTTDRFGELHSVLATTLQPENRLGQLGAVGVPNLYSEHPSAPLQLLWHDRELEQRVYDMAQRAFGIELTVNRHGGSQIGLHVGKPEASEPKPGERSPYHDEIVLLPQASAQGHGVQAFLGIVLTLISNDFDIVLIDEPEAFLHPPQARLLGEIFVEFSKAGTQIIVATHSDDFLQGVLTASGNKFNVTIARITRPVHDQNAVAQVAPAAVAKLYEDPLLRYSRILDGIFYKGVVICEAEADCKYYPAVLEHEHSKATPPTPRPDLLFTQCGGKDRFYKAVDALRATKVPTAVIADIDLLADRVKFTQLFGLMGGDPSELIGVLNDIESAVKSQAKAPERNYAKQKITEILDASVEKELSSAEVSRIRELVKASSGWELAKKNGKGALPSGQAVRSFDAVLAAAAKVGLFVLPIGELERFHPDIGGSKQDWLREVFESHAFESSPDAAALLKQVVQYIASAQ